MHLFGTLLRQVELRHLATFVSPSAFDVFPKKALWSQGVRLVANQRDKAGFQQCLDERQAELDRANLAVRLRRRDEQTQQPNRKLALSEQEWAHRVVTLYFHQVFFGSTLLLDMSAKALRPTQRVLGEQAAIEWQPAALYVQWDPEFRAGLQSLYRGFYLEDREAFQAGASRLGVTPLEGLFREHFGVDVTHTRFQLKPFFASFGRIFDYCKRHQIQLKGDFVVLGACLSTMYENLNDLDVVVDARQCFLDGSRVNPEEPGDLLRGAPSEPHAKEVHT